MTKPLFWGEGSFTRRRICVWWAPEEVPCNRSVNLGVFKTMKTFQLAFAALAASMFASQASAATIDFAAEAASGGERGVADGTVLNTAALGGLNLVFSAGVGGAASDFAYFNQAGTNPAGLGTCTKLGLGNQCNPEYDDTVASSEWVEVGFVDQPFDVRQISFGVDGDPNVGLVKITTSLNAVISMATMTFAQASTIGFGLVDWIRFEFAGTEFVVASISDIPLPGALPLLLSGLAGLGFAARRKKKA